MKINSAVTACLFFIFILSTNAKTAAVDSLKHLLSIAKEDSNHVLLLSNLSSAYIYSQPDSSMKFAREGVKLAQKIKYDKGEARCLNIIGAILTLTGNYPKALEAYHEALKIREHLNDKQGISSTLTNIGIIYAQEGDYRHALDYLLKAKQIDEDLNDQRGITSDYLNIGETYSKMNKIDSALLFTQRAYETGLRSKADDKIGTILNNLGNIHSKMGNVKLALEFYRLGIQSSLAVNNKNVLGESYYGMAMIYNQSRQRDSSIYFARKALAIAQETSDPLVILDAGKLLKELFESINATDSAFHYFKIAVAAKDSVFSEEKVRQVQILRLNEQLRQQEIAEEKAREEKERLDNLQYIGIGLFILTFFIILLLLSAKKVKPGFIEFLGLLGLLLLFEFISVLLDPIIGKLTHHTPVFILLISVGIAAMLVPLHRKLTKWVKEKLGKRNPI